MNADYFLTVLVISGSFYSYYYLYLRNKRYHQYNRFYLLFSVFASVCMPLLHLHLPVIISRSGESPMSQAIRILSGTASIKHVSTVELPFLPHPNITVYNYLYWGASCIALLVFAMNLLRIWKLYRKSSVQRFPHFTLVQTDEPGVPFSFFRLLFWGKNLSPESEGDQLMLRHELTHISQKHSLDKIAMEIITIIFWLNPFYYLIKHELKIIHEFLADEAAAKKQKVDYAELLIAQLLGTNRHDLASYFFPGQFRRRITMLTSPTKHGRQYLRKVFVIPLTFLFLMQFSFANNWKANLAGSFGMRYGKMVQDIPSIDNSLVNISENKSKEKGEGKIKKTRKPAHTVYANPVFINYRDDPSTLAEEIGVETAESFIPGHIKNRSLETEFIVDLKNISRSPVFPEIATPKAIVYPSRRYNEMAIIIGDRTETTTIDLKWRLDVKIYDQQNKLVANELLRTQPMGKYDVIIIDFENLRKGNYIINMVSSDRQIRATYKLVKDFGL